MTSPNQNRTKKFVLQIDKPYTRDIYLSCSWQPDAGQDASWLVVRELDQQNIRVVGDIPDLPTHENSRIRRIMSSCSGYVVMLPYRSEDPTTTSPFIVAEIRIAQNLNLPIAFFHDARVKIDFDTRGTKTAISFQGKHVEPIIFPKNHFFGPFAYDAGEIKLEHQIMGKLAGFLNNLQTLPMPQEPFAFFITRLQPDFQQAREAVRDTIEREAAIPCLWSDDNRHLTNIVGIRERTKELIKNSTFVAVDISLQPDNPSCENANRACELGIAMACNEDIFVAARGPRRDPFFSAADIQVQFWNDERDLRKALETWIRNREEKFCRRVYNRELAKRNPTYHISVIDVPGFSFEKTRAYKTPNALQLNSPESWLVAGSLGLIVLFGSLLLQKWTGFEDSFDYLPILLGIFAIVSASNLSVWLRNTLAQSKLIRWTVLLIGLILMVLWGIFTQ